ncbi:MAG: DUF1552 domain-containing protein [Acidobacteria bacterium]|nr:DUF1552 domain-containing protein [Acidobacteriota bacterium]
MFLTKKALPRRTFLRGLGATVALPLLDAMVPAATALAQTAAVPVRRFAAAYSPNGMILDHWTPATVGKDFALPMILQPFEPFRDHLLVVSGLHSGPSRAGAHALAEPTFMSGVIHPKRTEGADIEAGTTIDQVLARRYGADTLFPSIEICAEDFTTQVGSCEIGYSCAYSNTISWRTPTTPLPMELNPRSVFERLFSGGAGTPEERAARLRRRQSVLDAVAVQARSLQQTLAGPDRQRVDGFLQNVREIEQRIERAEKDGQVSTTLDAPIGVPESYSEHVGLMFDLMAVAFEADLTRVFTFMMGRELSSRTYPEVGVNEPHHAVSHHQNDPERIAQYAATNTYHAQLVARFLARLESVREGDATLLDNSLLLWGSGLSNPNVHSFDPLPVVLLGGDSGRLSGGRHLPQTDTPMANLLLSLAQGGGVEIDRFGDSTGTVSL